MKSKLRYNSNIRSKTELLKQLESLKKDYLSFFKGTNDQVFIKDLEALKMAILVIEENVQDIAHYDEADDTQLSLQDLGVKI